MRSLQTVKAKVNQITKKNGEMTSDDKEVAEVLCETFKEVFVTEDRVTDDSKTDATGEDDGGGNGEEEGNALVDFSIDNITKKLERLLPDKSPGPDEIHPMLLKQCTAEIARPLADIYQRSFNDGVIPKEWKLANISPIFKKGKKCDAGNYRPVSLTSVPCK